MEPRPLITVFTPTFNRVETLERVYRSLVAQTFNDFEWLVVDDGSTDATRETVGRWIETGLVRLRYCHQPNQGKHIAFNRAIAEARGELLCPLDSDDECVADALQRLVGHWRSIPETERGRFAGVACHARYTSGEVIGRPFPAAVMDSDARSMYYRHRVRGDLWGIVRLEVLRRFPFSTAHQGTYVPEGTVWFEIARHHRIRYVREALLIVHLSPVSMVRGVSAIRNAPGGVYSNRLCLNRDLHDFLWFDPAGFLMIAARYTRFALHTRLSLAGQWRGLDSSGARLLWALALPVGLLLFLRDRWRAPAGELVASPPARTDMRS